MFQAKPIDRDATTNGQILSADYRELSADYSEQLGRAERSTGQLCLHQVSKIAMQAKSGMLQS